MDKSTNVIVTSLKGVIFFKFLKTKMDKLIIGNTEYKLNRIGRNSNEGAPCVTFAGGFYVGEAIVDKPKDFEIIERYNYGEVPCDGEIAPIKKVKRMSDGEIFSVGERFNNNWAGISTTETISKFVIVDGKMRVYMTEDNGFYLLEHLEKVKKPLFNYVVFTKDGFGFPTWVVNDWKGKYRGNWDDSVFTFDDFKSASEHILYNQPCLSANDLFAEFVVNSAERRAVVALVTKKITNG